jgi:hypothetical protein
MFRQRLQLWQWLALHAFVAAVCAAAAMGLVSCSYIPWAQPDEKAVAAAEDEVYEAVVRDRFTPTHRQSGLKQLVFDEALSTERRSGADAKSCQEAFRKQIMGQTESAPLYNTLADRIYRLFTHGWADPGLRPETIENFAEGSCDLGRVSTTFHTDLPRSFVEAEKMQFRGWRVGRQNSPIFEELFPGASGIISLSHAGFDASLDEAIVSMGFYCGGLCGSGWRYFLKKRNGKWQVSEKHMVWVS